MEIITKTRTFYDCSVLEVEAGTTGERGGDTGNGGRTVLRFKNQGGDYCFHLSSDGEEVTFHFGGDAELRTLIDGLQFAADVLRQSKDGGTLNDIPTITRRMLAD